MSTSGSRRLSFRAATCTWAAPLGNDQITATKLASGHVNVVMNGEDLGNFTMGISGPDDGGLLVFAQAGDDNIQLVGKDDGSGNLVFPNAVALFGEDGNDTIDARHATSFIFAHGGAGDDILWGGSGRNTLDRRPRRRHPARRQRPGPAHRRHHRFRRRPVGRDLPRLRMGPHRRRFLRPASAT